MSFKIGSLVMVVRHRRQDNVETWVFTKNTFARILYDKGAGYYEVSVPDENYFAGRVEAIVSEKFLREPTAEELLEL